MFPYETENGRETESSKQARCRTPTAAGRPPTADRRPPPADRGAPRLGLHAARKHGPVRPRFAHAWPGRARATYKVGSGFDATVDLEVYMGMRYDFGGCLHCRISFLFPGRSPVRARTEALHRRNSPPTHQIRDVMAAAGFTTHSIQVMDRKRAGPRCPSTQTAAGAKSPCGRLQARPRVRLQLYAAALARPSPG